MNRRASARAYCVAVAAVASALTLRVQLTPLLDDHLPFITLFAAVAVSAWYGGRGPGLLAWLAGAVGVTYFILEPKYNLAVKKPEYQFGLVLYSIVCFALIALFESLRKARQRANHQRDLLQITLASIGDGVITTDAEGRVTRMNAVAESLTGWRNDDAVGQPLDAVFRIVNEATRKPVENPAIRALREGAIVGLANHTVLIAKDGTEQPIDDSAAPIRDNNEILGAVLVFRNISARRQAETALRRSEEHLSDFFDNAAIALHWVGPDGTILRVNQTELKMLGYGPEEYIGRHIAEFHADPPVIADILQRLANGETLADYNARLRCKDGSLRDVLINSNVLREKGQFIHTRCFTRDITGLKITEQALRESELRFRSLAEGMPHCVWICDASGFNEYQNRAWLEYTGAPPGSGHGQEWLDYYHPEDRPYLLEEWTKALREDGAHLYDIEVRIRRWDGEYRWFRVKGSPVKEADGTTIWWVGTCSDIHEQRILLGTLHEADRRKDEFLATLAHELRNPLAPVMNALELMKRANNNPETIEQARTTMERQIGQMVRLIDDLLDVSRITRDKLELKMQQVELASVVHHAVEACGPQCARAGHELNVSMPKEPIYLKADPVRLAQVFGNLLNNSCKYTDPGGRIWLTAERQGREVAVTVKDTGIGIPPEMLSSVFDMFAQVVRSSERAEGGLGIGLSLVKRLVELHGGAVTARSNGPNRGSEFVVRLPVIETAMPQPTPKGDPIPNIRRRILVVDDNMDSATSLAKLLELSGSEIQIAHDGVEAVEKATAFRPDTILLDIGLPKMNGYEACRAIREQSWGKDVTIVALTGWGQDEDRRKATDAGFNGHLTKPVEYEALMKLLAKSEAMKP